MAGPGGGRHAGLRTKLCSAGTAWEVMCPSSCGIQSKPQTPELGFGLTDFEAPVQVQRKEVQKNPWYK